MTIDKVRVNRINKNVTEYHVDGDWHRPNGPAFTNDSYPNAWYWSLFGRDHRYYGAAMGNRTWWIHGKCVK